MDNNDILKQKKVLFVDDRYEINKAYIRCIESEGAETTYVESVIKGIKALQNEDFDCAVIDLHMDIPDSLGGELESIRENFLKVNDSKRSMNAGQLVGMFINNSLKKKVKFIYLSAVENFYVEIEGGEPFNENKCFNKYNISPSQLADILKSMLTPEKEEDVNPC